MNDEIRPRRFARDRPGNARKRPRLSVIAILNLAALEAAARVAQHDKAGDMLRQRRQCQRADLHAMRGRRERRVAQHSIEARGGDDLHGHHDTETVRGDGRTSGAVARNRPRVRLTIGTILKPHVCIGL
jgi:hypothetical protein